jgi:hypothetical protein
LADLTARTGAIITMASSSSRQASQSSAAYPAAKAGVLALSRHLALELAPDRVRVNCLAPATVENDRIRTYATDEQRQQMAASFPLGRIGQPDDIAAAVLSADTRRCDQRDGLRSPHACPWHPPLGSNSSASSICLTKGGFMEIRAAGRHRPSSLTGDHARLSPRPCATKQG